MLNIVQIPTVYISITTRGHSETAYLRLRSDSECGNKSVWKGNRQS